MDDLIQKFGSPVHMALSSSPRYSEKIRMCKASLVDLSRAVLGKEKKLGWAWCVCMPLVVEHLACRKPWASPKGWVGRAEMETSYFRFGCD